MARKPRTADFWRDALARLNTEQQHLLNQLPKAKLILEQTKPPAHGYQLPVWRKRVNEARKVVHDFKRVTKHIDYVETQLTRRTSRFARVLTD